MPALNVPACKLGACQDAKPLMCWPRQEKGAPLLPIDVLLPSIVADAEGRELRIRLCRIL